MTSADRIERSVTSERVEICRRGRRLLVAIACAMVGPSHSSKMCVDRATMALAMVGSDLSVCSRWCLCGGGHARTRKCGSSQSSPEVRSPHFFTCVRALRGTSAMNQLREMTTRCESNLEAVVQFRSEFLWYCLACYRMTMEKQPPPPSTSSAPSSVPSSFPTPPPH
jgi:hypothetical protein